MPSNLTRRTAAALLLAVLIAAGHARAGAQEVVSRREAAAGAALLAGAFLLDRAMDGALPPGGGERLDPLADALNYGGRPQYAVPILAGTWAAGRLRGEGEVAEAAVHVTAALLAAGVVNGTLKYGIGRERPADTADPYRFRPFAVQNRWQSFPSGHAVVAFTLAAAVSEEARAPWVTVATYGGAAAVAWSRVYEDKHWTSDVAAGALIGILAGRGTVRLLHRAGGGEAPSLAFAPGAVSIRIPLR